MNLMKEIKPMVSVVMITYNHEAYINEAIEGVLMQVADFPIELIIADDCSPDKTQEIVQGYIDTHPKGHWIKYTRHEQNKGMMPNFVWALKQAKGEYIALCEGDDYWTDPLKLQKQVDFLEENEDFSGCAHRRKSVFMQDRIVRKKQMHENLENKIVSEEDLFSIYPFQTATFVFRKSAISNKFKWLNILKGGDINLYIVVASSGKIMKLGEEMSVYRIHEGGVTARYKFNAINLKVQKTKGFIKLSALFPKNNRKKISRVISHQAIQHIDTAVSLNQKENALKLLILFMRVTPINKIKIRWLIGSFKKCIISR